MTHPTTFDRGAGLLRLPALWGSLKRWNARRALAYARFAADSELEYRVHPPVTLAWRVEELVAPQHRLELAHELRSLVRDSAGRNVTEPERVNRCAVRAELHAFLAVADRLSDLSRPIAARGAVLVLRLLDDTAGPLYDRDRDRELGAYLDRVLDAMEPR